MSTKTIRYRIFRRHEVVALGVLGHALYGLAGVVRQDAIQSGPQVQDFTRLDLDIAGLPRAPPRGW